MVPISITDADDPRLHDYRALKERHLNERGGRFVAESERVVQRLVQSRLRVHSLLATPPRLASLADTLAVARRDDGDFPIYVATQSVLDRIAGFHVHRGCLAIGQRPDTTAVPARPLIRFARWPDDLLNLRAAGFTLVAATPRPGATPLPAFTRPPRLALLLGSEGPGLSDATLALADHQVAIPMTTADSPGADSLNVATAGAVLLYALGGPGGLRA